MSIHEDRFAGTGKNGGGRAEQGFRTRHWRVKTEAEPKIQPATGAGQVLFQSRSRDQSDAG